MARTEARQPVIPLEIRPSLALHLSPVGWGALVALVLALGALAFLMLLRTTGLGHDRAPADAGFATRAAMVASLVIGYTLAVWRWVGRAQARDFVALGVLPEGADEDLGLVHGVSPDELRKSRFAGLCGVALFVATVEIPNAIAGARFAAPWTSVHALTYMLLLGVLFFWIAGRAAYFSIGRVRYREVLDRLEIDLLDERALRVFGRLGLRNAFIWVMGISISMLAFVNPEIRIIESLIVSIPLLIVTLAIAAAAMMLPVRGLSARIAAAKREELARVEAAIRGDAGALAGSRIADREPPPSLADLIAYKGLVESVPDWPFDGSSFRRLGLYLLIPLASWIGGALVERGVSMVLD